MGEDQKNANRVNRGGSWANNGRNVRSAYRNNNLPDNRNNNIGFRLSLAQYRIGITVNDQIKSSLLLKQIKRVCRVSREVDTCPKARQVPAYRVCQL